MITVEDRQIMDKLKRGEPISLSEKSRLISMASKNGLLEPDTAIDYAALEGKLSHSSSGDGESRGYEGGTDIGGAASAAIGIGMKGIGMAGRSLAPGVKSVATAAKAAAQGKSFNDVAAAFGISAAKEAFGAIGGFPGMVGKMGLGIATSSNPAKAASKTGIGATAGLAFGPFGAIAGNILGGLAYDSYEDGYLGDALDSRKHEMALDDLEDQGLSIDDARESLAMDSDVQSGYTGLRTNPGLYGLLDADPSTFTNPNVSNYGYNPTADNPSFGDIAGDGYNDGGYGDAGGNGTGNNGGGDGNDNDSGAGGGQGSAGDGSGGTGANGGEDGGASDGNDW